MLIYSDFILCNQPAAADAERKGFEPLNIIFFDNFLKPLSTLNFITRIISLPTSSIHLKLKCLQNYT